MFFSEFCEIYKNTFSSRTPPVAASAKSTKIFLSVYPKMPGSKLAKFGQLTIFDMNRVSLLLPKGRKILSIEMDTKVLRYLANEH